MACLSGSCGDENPFSPTYIESGTGTLHSADNPTAYFQTDHGGFSGFSLFILSGRPIITAESGLIRSESSTAPDPGDYPKGLYPLAQENDPPVGAHYFMYVDQAGDRYFVRFTITEKIVDTLDQQASISYYWEMNTEAGSRNF